MACSGERTAWQVTDDVAGLDALFSRLSEPRPALKVPETTGRQAFEAACTPQAMGLAVAVASPRAAHDSARGMGALAAGMPAAFDRELRQRPKRARIVEPPEDAGLQRLQALVLRRRQLVRMISPERRRIRISDATARTSTGRACDFLRRERDDGDAKLAANVRRHHAKLAPAPVGLPDIGAAGAAPVKPDAGQMRGRRTIRDGRAKVQRTPYMATRTEVRHDALPRPPYGRLPAAGKRNRVAPHGSHVQPA